MQYALVNGERSSAAPGLSGICPLCNVPVVAKCGNIRVHHWAHSGERNCDPWWERETQWHRDWKNKFDTECQEIVLFDNQSGEKHIADVRTSHGLVIEFQHSYLRPDERLSREQFYKNIVWVVDGSRLKRDLPRFLEGQNSLRTVAKGIFITYFPQELLPKSWLNCSTPIFFDFYDGPTTSTRNGPLWCLLPGRAFGHAVIAAIQRQEFIRRAGLAQQIIPASAIVKAVGDALFAAQQARLSAEIRRYRRTITLSVPRYRNQRRPRRRRRF
jgi:hypothetical protein